MRPSSWMLCLLILSSQSHAQEERAIPTYRWACGDMSEAECRAQYANQAPALRQRPPEDENQRIALEIIDITNQYRRSQGLPALKVDENCMAAARDHTEDMARHDYLSHTGRNGSTPMHRYQRYSRGTRLISENIAYNMTGTADSFMTQWWNSPGHKKNILRAESTHIGVAVVKGQCSNSWGYRSCRFYSAQCFSRPSAR